MTYRFFTVAACIFSFLVLAGAGGLPTSNTSGSSSTSSSGGGGNVDKNYQMSSQGARKWDVCLIIS